jgi:hypothetical protein
MRVRYLLWFVLALCASALAAIACGGNGFESQNRVSSVRIFGVRPDKPYANPGETVTLEVLAADGRQVKPRPMTIYWIPIVCTNPQDDLYYLCFLPDQGDGGTHLAPPFPLDGGGSGAGGISLERGLASIPTGIDLGQYLPQGTTFSFQMPDDIIQARPGSPPYGLAIVFNIACAGQVRFAPRSGNAPQQIPIQCTDEQGTPLSPDDFVIGINRVYSYADRTNTNPVIEADGGVTVDGKPVDDVTGITVDRCTGVKHNADCKAVKIDVHISDSSWEPNPGEGESANKHEQIWATYYSDVGILKDEARLLFDSTKGRVSESAIEFRAPSAQPAQGLLWIVVHDNRAGAAFKVVPIHVK